MIVQYFSGALHSTSQYKRFTMREPAANGLNTLQAQLEAQQVELKAQQAELKAQKKQLKTQEKQLRKRAEIERLHTKALALVLTAVRNPDSRPPQHSHGSTKLRFDKDSSLKEIDSITWLLLLQRCNFTVLKTLSRTPLPVDSRKQIWEAAIGSLPASKVKEEILLRRLNFEYITRLHKECTSCCLGFVRGVYPQ
jgi:hypothetical protein